MFKKYDDTLKKYKATLKQYDDALKQCNDALKKYDETGEHYQTMECTNGRCNTTWLKEGVELSED